MTALRCALIGSGSSGNAMLLASAGTMLLVDCGYSARAFAERAADLALDPAAISAILVTHEHDDHLAGVVPLARRHGIPVYWTRGTRLAAAARGGLPHTAHEFSAHVPFTIGDIEVTPAPVPHDAREPCQFVFRQGAAQLGILTDLGSLTPHIVAQYRDCDVLILEFNHDASLLSQADYPESLKRRIAGPYGHLSNAQGGTLLARMASTRLRHLIAAHLSERTNHPDLVAECLAASAAGRDFTWALARQDSVLPWFEV